LEARPTPFGVPVVDDDVGDGFHAVQAQRRQQGALLGERSVVVIEIEILLGVIPRAVVARIARRRQPDQIKAPQPEVGGVRADDLVPVLRPELREPVGVPEPVRLPGEPLQHDPPIVERSLGVEGKARSEQAEG